MHAYRRYHHSRHVPGVPSPLRQLSATLLAVSAVMLCALVAAAVQWADAHPWALLVLGMAVAGAVAVRQSWRSRRIKQPVAETTTPHLPESVQPPRPIRQPAQQVVYWGKQRVGVLDSRGRFVPDR